MQRVARIGKETEGRHNICVEVDGKLAGSIGVTLRDDVYKKLPKSGISLQKSIGGKELLQKP
jgi:hypothetical protein